MADYLLEIGTEELPAGYIPEAQAKLQQAIEEGLRAAPLHFTATRSYSTPRRLTVIVEGIADKQETTFKKQKGPPVERSFEADGKPNKQALGFAERNGLKVEELAREKVGDVEYLFANVTTAGKPTAEVLAPIVLKAISQLPAERAMRWGHSEFKFSRPIRWIVSLLGNDVVPVQLDNLKSGRESAGHRILAPGKVTISNADKYAQELRKAFVIVDSAERKKIIEEQVTKLANERGGVPKQLKGSLLEEVVHITEWPSALVGEFEKEYLDLPDTLIETVMVHHQRYFPVKDKNAKETEKVNKNDLLPFFIAVVNNDKKEAQSIIKQGNERVLRARLADGRFFYFDDQKTKLSARSEALKQLTFQEGLGSYADKVERVKKLAKHVAGKLQLKQQMAEHVETTVSLCKLDLVCNLVRELPELQGYVGSWYAEQEGAAPEVVTAIASHYSPRSTDDTIPKDTVGMLTAVVDKLDNLVGLFAIGKKPSGSSDPYALRRQAQGIIDISIDGLKAYPIDITDVLQQAFDGVAPQIAAWSDKQPKHKRKELDRSKTLSELSEFINQRLKTKLLDLGAEREIVDAVMDARDPLANIPDTVLRCTCVGDLIASDGGLDLIRAGVRVGKILGADSPDQVDPALFQNDAERTLWEIFNRDVVKNLPDCQDVIRTSDKAEYERLLAVLRSLTTPVNDFFDNVMVNDNDQKLRNNRHGMLRQIDRYFTSVADFPKLQSLLL
ncbi:MAG TPA: glycine--tRNA ligase subunit beta [Planktothrix sp.]|jgi:glycyl-tRNA synthetase beta chain